MKVMVKVHLNRIQTTRLGLLETKFEKTVTNENKGAVENKLEKNVMSESNGDCSRNEDTSKIGTVSKQLEENIMNVSNGDGSLQEDTNNKTCAAGKEFEENC